MSTIRRRDVARTLAPLLGLNQAQCLTVFDTLTETILQALTTGNEVELYGLGALRLRHYAAHKGVDPRDQAPEDVPAKVRAWFDVYPAAKKRFQAGFEQREVQTQKTQET